MTDTLIWVVPGFLQDWPPSHFHEGCPNHTASTTGRTRYKLGTMQPISLLSSHTEISCKLLWGRWESQLPLLVGRDQSGFIPGRRVFHNVRRVLRVLHCQRAAKDVTWLSLYAGFSNKLWFTAAHLCHVLERLGILLSEVEVPLCFFLSSSGLGKNADNCTVLNMNNM